jgi:ring-1,2-phenylacetyl-CoA epoxidase subunit PaaA
VPELLEAGLTVPDPDMRYDEESGQWRHGPIEWDAFWQVIRGNGALNWERLAVRNKAHDEGAWVREAMSAYAEKQAAAAAGLPAGVPA